MQRWIVSALMLLASLATWAQPSDPRVVAYVQSARNLNSIVLANQDGSNAATVYSARASLSGVDFAPGGGTIAFVEASSGVGALKMLAYSSSSSGVQVTSVTTRDIASPSEPDFSPDGAKILYIAYDASAGAMQVREVAATVGQPTVLMNDMTGVMEVAWFRSGDRFVYLREYASDMRYEVRLVTLDTSSRAILSDTLLVTTDGSEFRAISHLDVARTRDSILLTLNYPTSIRIVEYDTGSGIFTDYGPGMRGHFSSDDSRIVHLDSGRTYVYSLDVGSRNATRLTKKGSFSWTDARP